MSRSPFDTGPRAAAPPLVPQPTAPPVQPAPPSAQLRRRRPPATSMRVHIERLVLDGIDLDPRDERSFQAAAAAELAALLSDAPLPALLGSGGMARGLPGPTPELGPWSDAEDLGGQLARAVHRGLCR